MRVLLGASLLLATAAAAHGDDTAPPRTAAELLDAQTRTAHDAGVHGHCDVVRDVAKLVEPNPEYYSTTFVADPAIAACMMATPEMTVIATEQSGVHAPSESEVIDLTTPRGTPPLSANRIFGEAAIGGVFLVGGALGGGLFGYGVASSDCGPFDDNCGLGGIMIGGLAGIVFATPLGVYVVGSRDGQTGSLGAAIAGSLVGTAAAVAMFRFDQQHSLPAFVVGPLIGSMIGFNVTRRYERKQKPATLVPVANVSHGTASVGVVGRF